MALLTIHFRRIQCKVSTNKVPLFSDILVLTQRSDTVQKARHRYIKTSYYLSKWVLGPPPWEDTGAYEAVNEYHVKAALTFREMSSGERREAARNRLAQLEEADKVDVDDDLDGALLKSIKDYGEQGRWQFNGFWLLFSASILYPRNN